MDFFLNKDLLQNVFNVILTFTLPIALKCLFDLPGNGRVLNRLKNKYYVNFLDNRLKIYTHLYFRIVSSPLGVEVPLANSL